MLLSVSKKMGNGNARKDEKEIPGTTSVLSEFLQKEVREIKQNISERSVLDRRAKGAI